MASLEVKGRQVPGMEKVLSKEALAFVEDLQGKFGPTRKKLLAARGKPRLDFLPETEGVRKGDWKVAPTPADLQKRHVEITGPVERKMMINALNSGADVFMADFEDSLSPTWENVVRGQANLIEAVRRRLEFISPEGKQYRLHTKTATLVVR